MRVSAGHADHEHPANQGDWARTSDRAWTRVLGLVFPLFPCSVVNDDNSTEPCRRSRLSCISGNSTRPESDPAALAEPAVCDDHCLIDGVSSLNGGSSLPKRLVVDQAGLHHQRFEAERAARVEVVELFFEENLVFGYRGLGARPSSILKRHRRDQTVQQRSGRRSRLGIRIREPLVVERELVATPRACQTVCDKAKCSFDESIRAGITSSSARTSRADWLMKTKSIQSVTSSTSRSSMSS